VTQANVETVETVDRVTPAPTALVEVEGLSLSIPVAHGDVPLLDDVSLTADRGGAVGIVGESGSGKSLLGLTLLGLAPADARTSGTARFDGMDLLALDRRAWGQVRGSRIAMVYQDALTSLNPGMRVGRQLALLCRRAGGPGPAELLERVQLPSSRRILRAYPHQLSGGQRQRVLIAMALAGSPELIVADEPTTALDVTVQAQIVGLLADIRRDLGVSLLLISHDLALVAQMADWIVVMYAGQVVETGPPDQVLGDPRHPYTVGLLRAQLSLEEPGGLPAAIPGAVPSPAQFPVGCRFSSRCPRVLTRCAERPPLAAAAGRHGRLACHNPTTLEAP